MIKSRVARTVGTTFLSEKALTSAVHRAVDRQGNPTPGFQRAVLSALTVQRPVVLANLRRLRRRYPEATPAELADKITVLYLRSLTTTGAAAGEPASSLVSGPWLPWASPQPVRWASLSSPDYTPNPLPSSTVCRPAMISAVKHW